MALTIRQATIEDAPLLARLCMAVHDMHVEAMPERFKPMRADMPELIAHYREQLEWDCACAYIAELDGVAAGHALCLIHERPENIFAYAHKSLHIDQFSVEPSYWRKGVGTALVNHLRQKATELGIERITLGVYAFNEGAIAFYRKQGFEFVMHNMVLGM